jgi:hypothetical protein
MAFAIFNASKTVTLRSPDFGNKTKIEVRKINRKSRGGDIIMYRDSEWPRTSFYQVSFSFLKEQQAKDLLKFLMDTLGEIISFTDHEGFTRNGIVITPNDPIVQAGREDFQASFEIQVQE